MTTFASAIQSTPVTTTTTNGMIAQTSSTNPIVDLFYTIGSARNSNITALFDKAMLFNMDHAIRVLLYARDIREGLGERKTFRNLLLHMEKNYKDTLSSILYLVPEMGRFDDLLIFETKEIQEKAYGLYAEALNEGNQLAGKWAPRKGPIANNLRKFLRLTPKDYRKLIVSLTNVVEQKLCAKEFDTIEFGKLPSIASSRYQKTFLRRCRERYNEYKEGLASGKEKVNASALYPYDVIRSLDSGDPVVSLAQWEALPNYVGDARILPVCDVSGSMDCKASGSVTCMDISISLGLYISDKNKGVFKDCFVTFSADPKIEVLRGNLVEKYNQLRRSDWGMNTNIEKTFNEILRVAVTNNVPQEEMPEYILIISDMQFDKCGNDSCQTLVEKKFRDNGYNIPKIVYWNVNSGYKNIPVSSTKNGTLLISGFSTKILESILRGKMINSVEMVNSVIMNPRYNWR